jgi:hypothetical protein
MARVVRLLLNLVAIVVVVSVTPASAAPRRAAALSPTLSYYFVPGTAFTPNSGNYNYSRSNDGCIYFMNRYAPFSAPVYLPPASQVVSMTLFSYNDVLTTTIGMVNFVINDGLGLIGGDAMVTTAPNIADYQQTTGSFNVPTTIDYEKYNYSLWWETQGDAPSPHLALCGVRLAYYAPTGATFLPLVTNP